MAVTTINRTNYNALADDDGSNTVGSLWNKNQIKTVLLDQIDAILAANVVFGGTITERNRTVAMGEWTSVAFSAGNFTGDGTITWTVGSSDQETYAYTLIGKTMTVAWRLVSTSTGGTGSTSLQIAIPGGFTTAKQIESTHWYNDNGGGWTAGIVEVAASATKIALFKANFAAWSNASTNNTGTFGQITFEVL